MRLLLMEDSAVGKNGGKKHIISELAKRALQHDIKASAAQMSYFLLMSLFPSIMLFMTILGYLSISIDDSVFMLSMAAPKEVVMIIDKYLEYLATERHGELLAVSLIATLWTSSSSLDILIVSLNRAYSVKETRGFIRRKLLVIPFMVMIGLCLTAAFVIPVLGKGFLIWLSYYVNISGIMIYYLYYMKWFAAVLMIFSIILCIYYIVPVVRLSILSLVPGALFSTLGWIVISLGFSIYVRIVSGYALIYGSIGAIIVLMVWLFIGTMVIVLGGELNALLNGTGENQKQVRREGVSLFPDK
ncbi:MAG: YihY/virulence factor BrkB family protein [Caulobacteraceae bacterium]